MDRGRDRDTPCSMVVTGKAYPSFQALDSVEGTGQSSMIKGMAMQREADVGSKTHKRHIL